MNCQWDVMNEFWSVFADPKPLDVLSDGILGEFSV